jgi:hypothetical protein
MKKRKRDNRRMGITWFTREAERTFFFYATVVMFLLYALSRLLNA